MRHGWRRWALASALCLGLAGCDWGCPDEPSDIEALVLDSCSAAPLTGNAPLPVTFSAKARQGEFSSYRFNWFFGDGGTAGETVESEFVTPRGATHTVAHTYAAAGTFTATMTVTNGEESLSCSLQIRTNVALSR